MLSYALTIILIIALFIGLASVPFERFSSRAKTASLLIMLIGLLILFLFIVKGV